MSDRQEPPVQGIVVCHGTLAAGLVDALQRIAGLEPDAVRAVSNHGRGPEELIEAVGEATGTGPAIIFVDLQSGSCALAARLSCRHPGGRRVIAGVNLPMLLDFAFQRHLPLDELVERLVERGREAVVAFPFRTEHADPPVPR